MAEILQMRDTPTLARLAQPRPRDRWAVSTHRGGITPERLSSVLHEAERGRNRHGDGRADNLGDGADR